MRLPTLFRRPRRSVELEPYRGGFLSVPDLLVVSYYGIRPAAWQTMSNEARARLRDSHARRQGL